MTTIARQPALTPGGMPLLGHGLDMKRRPGDLLLSLQSGDPVTVIRLGRRPMYVINDADLMRQVMRAPDIFARGGPITERFRVMFGNGLGISDGEFHRRQRRLLQPAFHRSRIIHYSSLISALVVQKVEEWPVGETLQVEREMDELALANVTQVIFAPGTSLDQRRFMDATGVVLGGLFRRMTDTTGLLTKLPTQANRRYRESEEYLRRTIHETIREYRASGEDRGDLLSMMLLARDDDGGSSMSDQQIHDEVLTFFIAGSNTISNTLAWAFHEIATHPEVERQLHEEVDRVLAGRAAEFDDVARLEYTRRVLTETLRLRTQGFFQTRTTTRDTELGGYRIPGGEAILYSFYALMHNPEIFAEPETFDADRWLPDRLTAVQRNAFMPFGAGVHGCIGETFSWTELIIVLATIAARRRLVSVPGHQPRPKPAVTMPVDSLPMTVHRR
ncbi:pentalenene oxygenase [Nocardia tenerifensis]|uniref:Pentalenene oxygenase n=1 Tax=Nocardia tenerifensis TaxID=228006 RepID=A0A318K7U6_9NOCA|nr:cytochrome P450 [Nocardia tenerifensis]PXX70591.1 pentalenene oxygenase [Nocardia tenerifensis]